MSAVWEVWYQLESSESEHEYGGVWPDSDHEGPSPSGFHSRMGRVERVQAALEKSRDDTMVRLVADLKGIELAGIVRTLVDAATEMATLMGASVIIGFVLGGVGGLFAGGLGAAPGAAIGAAAGGQVGIWVLGFLGLKSLLEDLGNALPRAYTCYREGFSEAWGPAANWDRYQEPAWDDWYLVSGAARHFTDGHGILLMALLSAMVAYLTRGKGDRSVLLQEIRQSSRLGPRVADWVVANEEKLRNHPALKVKERPAVSATVHEKPQPVAETPSRAHGYAEKAERKPVPMEKAKVPCFKADNLPQGSVPEFDRQLAGQEKGLNDLTVEEYTQGRETYKNRDPKIAQSARADYQDRLQRNLEQDMRERGVSPREARAKATEQAANKMKTLAALHNPDLFSGGKDVIADFGDKRVNSSIGAQWRSRVSELDGAAAKIAPENRSGVKMNAELKRCK